MAATTTTGFAIPATEPAVRSASIRTNRRRRITSDAGRALEILGHAIEYLTDEFVQDDRAFNVKSEQLQAVQMLMALNRQVYFECPELPTLGERWRALLHIHSI
jgi:hypothetical protein